MEQYNNAANEKAAAEENVKTRQEGMAKLKKDKEMWEKKMKMLASVEQKKDKFKEIKRELCWTMVNEYVRTLRHFFLFFFLWRNEKLSPTLWGRRRCDHLFTTRHTVTIY